MAELTPLATAVLGLLAERPMHAYEMYQLLLQRQIDRVVKVRPGSLYHTVERLAGQEYVRAVGVGRSGNRPERTTYEITPAGHAAVVTRIETGLETFVDEYPIFPVMLREGHGLSPEDAVARLRRRIAELETRLTALDDSIQDFLAREVPEAYWIANAYMRHQLAAEREWLSTLIDRIESKDLEWQPHVKK